MHNGNYSMSKPIENCHISQELNVHVIGQKARGRCHLHIKFVFDSVLSLAYHESCVSCLMIGHQNTPH